MKYFIVIVSLFIFNSTYAQVKDFEKIDFTRADSIAKINKGESLKNLSLLSYNLTSDLTTDVEKFRAIYVWVSNNVSADFNQYKKVIRKRIKYNDDSLALLEWNNKYGKIAFKKLLKHKKTMCTGYAYLIKELSLLLKNTTFLIFHSLTMKRRNKRLHVKWSYLCVWCLKKDILTIDHSCRTL